MLFTHEVEEGWIDNHAEPLLVALLGLLAELRINREMAPSRGQTGERKHYKWRKQNLIFVRPLMKCSQRNIFRGEKH